MTQQMPSPAAPLAQRARRQQPAAAPRRAPDPALAALIERAAALPRGLALLHHGPLEPIAVLLSVHPGVVERARADLEDPRARAAAIALFAEAARRHAPAVEAPPPPRRAPDPEALVAEAARRPGGTAVLASAAVECAAISFGVHPDVVLAARALLPGRGGDAARVDRESLP
jgi:hypothetical protein